MTYIATREHRLIIFLAAVVLLRNSQLILVYKEIINLKFRGIARINGKYSIHVGHSIMNGAPGSYIGKRRFRYQNSLFSFFRFENYLKLKFLNFPEILFIFCLRYIIQVKNGIFVYCSNQNFAKLLLN